MLLSLSLFPHKILTTTQTAFFYGVRMESEHEKSKKVKTQKAPAEQDRSGEQASNKVPENAENFEHVLRRLTIEKNQAKRRS